MILANGCNITKSEKFKGVWILSVPTVYKPRGIKESSHNGSKWSRLQWCPLQLATIEDIKKTCLSKEFYSNIAYQHDDDEFVSKCN